MDREKQIEIVEALQETVNQIRLDDIEECPESAFEEFQCQCCGETKMLAGSLLYEDYLLCNDCVLLAEIGFALKKITNIQELIDSMEDKRFESLYNSLFENKGNINN